MLHQRVCILINRFSILWRCVLCTRLWGDLECHRGRLHPPRLWIGNRHGKGRPNNTSFRFRQRLL